MKISPDRHYGSDPNGMLKKSAWVGLTTAAGAVLGHQRSLTDTVTVERIPYPETVQVANGTRVENGCYQYHYGYDFSKGEFGFHYGYDSSCRRTVTNYDTVATGNTLYREVEHHSQSFPRNALQGAALGFGLGVVTAVLAHAVSESLD